jgi:lysophospholipid acyltransferase (LPLAT)-like uncharacterized protein
MKIRFRNKAPQWLVTLCAWMIKTLGNTIRFHIHDPHHTQHKLSNTPLIFAFWHRHILLMPTVYKLYASSKKLTVLISRSGDGEFIARIIEHFGLQVIRGSTKRAGHLAMRQLVVKLRNEQCHIAFTPDGPRGPRGQVKPGILYLSQSESIPIIPIYLSYQHKITLNSWDRFIIPLPFTQCTIHVGKPLLVPPEEDLTHSPISKDHLTAALGPTHE